MIASLTTASRQGLLDRRPALVTGAASAIGRAICIALAGAGAWVCVTDRHAGEAAPAPSWIEDRWRQRREKLKEKASPR